MQYKLKKVLFIIALSFICDVSAQIGNKLVCEKEVY